MRNHGMIIRRSTGGPTAPGLSLDRHGVLGGGGVGSGESKFDRRDTRGESSSVPLFNNRRFTGISTEANSFPCFGDGWFSGLHLSCWHSFAPCNSCPLSPIVNLLWPVTLSPPSFALLHSCPFPLLRFSPPPAVFSHVAPLSSLTSLSHSQLLLTSAGHCLLRSCFAPTPP